MELKGALGVGNASLRRGYELLKAPKQKKKNRAAKHVVQKANNGGVGVVSCTEEAGGVVRMKIVVRKSELKQLVEVMSGVKGKGIAHKSTMSSVTVPNYSSSSSSVEQRLNNLLWKKYLSRAKPPNGNHHKCWSPVLQSIPEEL